MMDPQELAMLIEDAAATYVDAMSLYELGGSSDAMGGKGRGAGLAKVGGPYDCRYAKTGLTPSERVIAGQIGTYELEVVTCRPDVPVARGQYIKVTPHGEAERGARLVYAVMGKTDQYQLRILIGEEST